MSGATRWDERPEHGAAALLQAAAWLALRLGRHAEAMLPPIALFFLLASPGARAASREFLRSATGRAPGPGALYRHMLSFAATILDRVLLAAGGGDGFTTEVEGAALLHEALGEGRGCLLLGAHFGNFDALRVAGQDAAALVVRPVMLPGHSARLMRLLARHDAALAGVIELGRPGAMLEVRDGLGRGEVVGLLADRTLRGQRQRALPFLGREARFPTGPIQLAASLGAPVLLFRAARRGRRRYHARFERFSPRPLPGEAAGAPLARYVARLEAWCREDPFNWFNFFPFWA